MAQRPPFIIPVLRLGGKKKIETRVGAAPFPSGEYGRLKSLARRIVLPDDLRHLLSSLFRPLDGQSSEGLQSLVPLMLHGVSTAYLRLYNGHQISMGRPCHGLNVTHAALAADVFTRGTYRGPGQLT